MPAKLRQFWTKLLRLGFHLLYNQLAWIYDSVSWLVSFGAWRDWQRAALPYVQGREVLEIAHGPGHMLLALQEAGYQVLGLDRSPQMGALSRDRLNEAGVAVPLLCGSAQNLPLRSKSFDSVLVTFPTEFLLHGSTLAAVHRVLKDKGRFIIVPEAQFTGHSLPVRVVEWLYLITGQRQQEPVSKEAPSQSSDGTRWESVKEQFRAAGFHLEIHTVTLQHSQATVLLSQKTDPDEPT